MKVHHVIEGAISARLAARLGGLLTGEFGLDCVVVFAIRGDERLPSSLVPLLRSLMGQRAAFVIIGDYSRPPDGSHSVVHGLREWVEPQGEEWITWVDAPVRNERAVIGLIATWITDAADGALIRNPHLPPFEMNLLLPLRQRLGKDLRIDLSDRAPYDRSLWGRFTPAAALEVSAAISDNENLEALNLGWVEPNPPVLLLPPKLREFRARGLQSLEGWLGHTPCLEELVLVGGGLSRLTIPERTLSTLRCIVLDKNSLSALPEGLENAPLSILSIYRNNFDILPREIRKMSQLRSLTIGANSISALPEWLAELPALTAVDISGLQLDLASSAVIATLRERGVIVRTRKASLGGLAIPDPEFEPEFPRLPAF